MQLLKKTRNELVEAIKQSGLSLTDFATTEEPDALTIRHEQSASKFVVMLRDLLDYEVHWSAGGGNTHRAKADEDGIAIIAREWIEAVQVEVEAPDLWTELAQGQEISALMESQENTPFSLAEQKQIAGVLADIKKQAVETYGLPPGELRLLEAKLDYLIEAAPHARRIDWLNTAVGAVGGAFAGGVLTPEVVHKVLTALSIGVGGLFGHPVPLLSP